MQFNNANEIEEEKPYIKAEISIIQDHNRIQQSRVWQFGSQKELIDDSAHRKHRTACQIHEVYVKVWGRRAEERLVA